MGSKMRVPRFTAFTVGGIVGLSCLLVPQAHAAAPAPSPMIYGVSSVDPPAATTKLSTLQQSAANGTAVLSPPAGAVQTSAATPSGYKLINPGHRVTDYIYQSDSMYHSKYQCDAQSNCVTLAATKASEREYVRGTTSKYWELTQQTAPYGNFPENGSWSLTALYSCGVNISGGDDHTCGNGADASGTSISTNGTAIPKKFEAVNGNIVFPMVAITTNFSGGVVVTTKFRGWDVKNTSSTTKLNATSGTGA